MAALPGFNKKVTTILVIFIITQILVVIMVWIAFSGSDEREGRIRATFAFGKAGDMENAVASYYNDHKSLPASNDSLRAASRQGKPYFTAFEERGEVSFSASVANGVITLTFLPDQKAVSGKSLIFIPRVSDGKLEWSCDASSLEVKQRPSQCRGE